MKKVQAGDKVIVTAGKWKGTTSVVVSIVEKKDTRRGSWVVLKGVNIVKKGVKGKGFQEFEAPIHISNINLLDEKSGSGSKVGIKEEKGKKVRYLKKTGEVI